MMEVMTMADTPEIELGRQVRDTVTGFEGTAVCRSEWMNGCVRVTVQPPGITEKGKTFDTETFDEGQLEYTVDAASEEPALERTGGPTPDAVRWADPE